MSAAARAGCHAIDREKRGRDGSVEVSRAATELNFCLKKKYIQRNVELARTF